MRNIRISQCLLIFFFCCPFLARAAVSEWVPFTWDDGHITISGQVAGVDAMVVLDSGAWTHGISQSFREVNKLDFDHSGVVEVYGALGKESRKQFVDVPVTLFGVSSRLDNVLDLPMPGDSAMLIGAPLFQAFIFQIDYPNLRMRIMSRDSLKMRELKNIPARLQQGLDRPIVKVSINQRPVWLLVDTGFTGAIMLDRKAASQLDLLDSATLQTQVSGVHKTVDSEIAIIDDVSLGPFEMESVPVVFTEEGEQSYLESRYEKTGTRIKGKKVVGVLGADMLKHFVVTMDYKSAAIHLGVPDEVAEGAAK